MDAGKNEVVDPTRLSGPAPEGLVAPGEQLPPGSIVVPAMQVPPFRVQRAAMKNRLNHILFIARGGVGDQICAEPTLRYSIEHFGNKNKFYLAAYDGLAELFTHLKFERVFDLREEQPIWENYLVMETIVDQTRQDHNAHMSDEFFSHCLTHCVDFASMSALRAQLPTKDREIKLDPRMPRIYLQTIAERKDTVFIHPGRHWQSKTFPPEFWAVVVKRIGEQGMTAVIIGADRKDTGTVQFEYDEKHVIDLRNKTTLAESLWLLKHARCLLTNDSAPLHGAASGDAYVGFIATIKHPDYITHWRHGEFGWRMRNFGKSGVWDIIDHNPGNENPDIVGVEWVKPEILASWLPDPIEYADWAVAMSREWRPYA
jgi:ADP-heptose:LPS heptosyltransferase